MERTPHRRARLGDPALDVGSELLRRARARARRGQGRRLCRGDGDGRIGLGPGDRPFCRRDRGAFAFVPGVDERSGYLAVRRSREEGLTMDAQEEPRLLFPKLKPFYDRVAPLTWPLIRLTVGLMILPHGWPKLMAGVTATA